MTIEVKHGGAWRTITAPEVKHAGSWRAIQSVEVKHAGTWRTVFTACTLTTASLDATNVSRSSSINWCYAQVRYDASGNEWSNTGYTNNYNTSRGAWLDAGDACGGWIDHTLNSGSALYTRAQVPGTRAQMTANRDYQQRDTNIGAGAVTSNITVKMYDAQTGGTLKSSATFTLTANYYDPCPLCCFTPDTLITMSDGKEVPIGMIREGDEIVVYDPDNGTFDVEVVEEILTRVARRMYKITFDNGTVLHASDDHPLHVDGQGPHSIVEQPAYKHQYETKELKVGQWITCIRANWWDGHDVERISKIEYAEYLQEVYTLGNSFFFANGKLVY